MSLTASHLGIGVLPQMGIQHGITDLVTDLVWRRSNMCKNHRDTRSNKLKYQIIRYLISLHIKSTYRRGHLFKYKKLGIF